MKSNEILPLYLSKRVIKFDAGNDGVSPSLLPIRTPTDGGFYESKMDAIPYAEVTDAIRRAKEILNTNWGHLGDLVTLEMRKIFQTSNDLKAIDGVNERLKVVENFKNLNDAFTSYESLATSRNQTVLLIGTLGYFMNKLNLMQPYN